MTTSPWDVAELRYALTEVIEEGIEPTWYNSHRRTLIALACVSRSFTKPAITSIWRDLPTVKHILNLMPSVIAHGGYDTIVQIYQRYESRNTWHIKGEARSEAALVDDELLEAKKKDLDLLTLKDEDWTAISRYAAKVKRLRNNGYTRWCSMTVMVKPIPPVLLDQLQLRHESHGPIFPK
jgi:hypothetical protein